MRFVLNIMSIIFVLFFSSAAYSGGGESGTSMARNSASNLAKHKLVDQVFSEIGYNFNINQINIPEPQYSMSEGLLKVHVKGEFIGHFGRNNFQSESSQGGQINLEVTLKCEAIIYTRRQGVGTSNFEKIELPTDRERYCKENKQ